MASALALPASSGAITGTGADGGLVNVVGFTARSGASAVSVNIREASSTGNIVLYLYLPANTSAGDMFPRTLTAKAPLYCEFVTGAAAGLGAVYIG